MTGERRLVRTGTGAVFRVAEEANWERFGFGLAAGAVRVGRVGGDSMGVPNASLDEPDLGAGFF